MSMRDTQKEKRRQEILEAALDQFIRRGYAATKITDIAEKAGMSTGLLFHYFESKQALYTALIQLGTAGPQQMLQGVGQPEPLLFFTLCAQSTLAYAADSPFTAKMFVLMGSAYYSEGIPQQAREIALTLNYYESFAPLILEGQRQGTIRQGDAVALSTAFWSALQGSIGAYALNPQLPLPKAEWIVDIIREKKQEA